MNMRERIARAIAETPCNGISIRQMMETLAEGAAIVWNEEFFIRDMTTIADAVLDAMREPTPEMVDATEALLDPYDRWPVAPEQVFTAMIDAAK